jgi:hypothetical protein
MVILWYGLVPMTGAMVKRYKWHIFRKRFDELRLSPLLDYGRYSRQEGDGGSHTGMAVFRFVGGFESITDGQTLWIRGDDLTVPVSLQNAETYLLPMQKGDGIPEIFDPSDETPEKIRWERVSALTEGARVYVGGLLVCRDGRWSFASTKEKPLMVIFYDGPDHSLTTRAIRAGRHRDEYWNAITPYSLVIGALCQIITAVLFLSRPAFRLTVMVSLAALFVPLYPMIPPGLLFTVMYRRLVWRSRILRSYRDLARLPLRYLTRRWGLAPWGGLPNGELYGFTTCAELPPQAQEGKIPLLLPELTKAKENDLWYIFGALRPGEELPVQPQDSFATFGILPGKPEVIAKRCEIAAYTMEGIAWLILFAGIGLNIFFLSMVLVLL